MKLIVKNRAGAKVLPDGLEVKDDATVKELKAEMHRLKPKLYPSRQRWSVPADAGSGSKGSAPVVLKDGSGLSEAGIRDGSTLIFKDLGPQIGYQTVFFWEYLGPLVIYALVYLLPASFVYPASALVSPALSASSWFSRALPSSASSGRSLTQTLACVYWCFHYAKRIYETFHVHRFSHATMPLFNLVKNCTYYWLFALYVAYFVNHPLYTAPGVTQTVVCLVGALACQLVNYRCHVVLANLRGPGSLSTAKSAYVIPRGFWFEWVACPNYTAEIFGWVLFTVATQTAAAGLFTLVGAGQMFAWAMAKHSRLRRLFNGKDGKELYRVRYVLLPGVV